MLSSPILSPQCKTSEQPTNDTNASQPRPHPSRPLPIPPPGGLLEGTRAGGRQRPADGGKRSRAPDRNLTFLEDDWSYGRFKIEDSGGLLDMLSWRPRQVLLRLLRLLHEQRVPYPEISIEKQGEGGRQGAEGQAAEGEEGREREGQPEVRLAWEQAWCSVDVHNAPFKIRLYRVRPEEAPHLLRIITNHEHFAKLAKANKFREKS